jgi:WD40 repeat protein
LRRRTNISRAVLTQLSHFPRRHRIVAAAHRRLSRAALGALVCLAGVSLSYSRQQPRRLPQANATPQARAAQQPSLAQPQDQPQNAVPRPQAAIAVAAAEPDVTQGQQAQAAGQPPDRVFNNGHTSSLTAVAFSPDRHLVATGADDRTIRIWDAATATEQRVLNGPSERINAIAFSPDGARLASASGDGTARVWDPATGNPVYSFTLPTKFVEQIAFSSDGKLLAASAGADDEGGHSYIEVHDASTGARIHGITLDWNNATPLLITPDGRLLSSGGAGEDGEYVSAKAWDAGTGRELKSLEVFFGAFSPDGHWGASLEYQQGTQINLWDIAAGRRVRTINIPGFEVARAVFTPDGTRVLAVGRRLANGQNPGEGKFFEVATGKEVQSLPISYAAVAFSADGEWLASGSGSSVKIWDLAAGHEIETLAGQLAAQDLVFSPDGKQLITGGEALGVWDVTSGKLIRTVEGGVQSLIISPDGRWLAANPKGSLEIWDTKTWMRVTPAPPSSQYVWWMGFTPPQSSAPDLSAAGLKWWQVGAGQEARSVWGTTFAAALSPDGKILATAALRQPSASNYDRPNVGIWDASAGRLVLTFAAHEVGVSGLVFSPDGKWLATAGQESRLDPRNLGASLASMRHSLKLWDTATWQMRTALQFMGMVGGLGNFSPDGRLLAVTSENSVTLYKVPDGRAVKTFSGAGGVVRFSPDGQWLARASAKGIALWNLAGVGK